MAGEQGREQLGVAGGDRVGVPSGSSPLSRRARDPRASSRALVRFPLWPSAMWPVAVDRKVGCAFSHTLAPVVE